MGNKKSIGLRGGPNEFLQTFTDNISIEGYRRNSPDVNKLFNVIPSGDISMEGVDFPVVGTDNLGNTKTMQPGMNYQFPGDSVLETRLAQRGFEIAQDARMRNDIQTGQNSGADMAAGLWKAITSGAGTVADYYTELKELAGANPITKKLFDTIDPVTNISHALDILSVPGSLIAETVEGVGGQGDGQFNITDAIPNMSGDFSFTNINNEPVKNVAGVLGVENPVGAFALNLFTDPSTYVGAGLAKNVIKKGIRTGAKSIDNVASKFTSDINWGNWHKSIPENKILLQEYQLIEETTKANGTWMKNADGSPFSGRPEQFVQQKSGNFQKAYPNALLDDAGNPLINYHGSGSKFNAFDESKFYSGQYGKGVYTSPDKEAILKSYANAAKKRTQTIAGKSGTDSPTSNLYELYINSKNPLSTDDILDFRNFGKTVDELPSLKDWKNSDLGKRILAQNTYIRTDDDIISFIKMNTPANPIKESFIDQGGDFLRAVDTPLQEGVTPFSNQMKSALGNNGMFDMTNTNIYQKFGGSLSKAQVGGEQGKTWRDIEINKEGLKRAIAEVESINGVLMINPESTATGLYGQRFSELEEGNLYEGTRGEFAKDLEAQERIFDMRLNEGIKSNKTTPLLKDAFDLTNEYKDQLGDKWNYSYEDLIALSNFLGRGGTREFLGNVIRDGKTLEEVYPTKFGKGAKQANKTPYEYLKKTRDYYQEGGDVNYTVVEGDNLGRIANKYKTSVDELARLNNISDPNKININQELIISQSKKPAAITNSYNVRSGDTLGKIAKTYNTTAKKLAEYNSIEDMNMIQVNQQIAIPDNIRKQVKKSEPAWYGVDDVKARNIETNSGSDTDIIMTSQLLNNPNQSYVIIDKKSGQLRVMNGEDEALSFEVLTGANPGDAQTVTKMKDLDGDGKITDADKINNQWVTDWSGGNKSTGAGIYSIGSSSPTSKPGYQDAPSWTLKNDNGIAVSTAIHGTTNYRKQFFNDGSSENNQASNGCINGQCSDLDALYDLDLPMGTPIFILPEDEGNNFVLQDGKAIMKMSQKNRSEYLNYTDSEGRTQKGQGGNYTTNSLIYKPIRSKFNEEKFREEVFSVFDFDDEEELKNTTLPFIQALQDNKREIMLKAQIPGDVYNQIAKMSFGVFGLESNFGDTHSWAGNAARGANKKYGNDKSSPDVVKKYEGFNLPFTEVGAGATKDNNSVGYTQIRWSELNDKEKSALKSFDITSNEDFFDPKKSAIATATILGIRYNEQLTTDQKKDIWKYLPTKWNKRSNYVKRVKDFSVYLDFEQKDVMGNGGETENHIMYKNYVNGVYEGSKMQIKGAKIYDKLNRIHYRDAKASNMAPANYVMTNVIG